MCVVRMCGQECVWVRMCGWNVWARLCGQECVSLEDVWLEYVRKCVCPRMYVVRLCELMCVVGMCRQDCVFGMCRQECSCVVGLCEQECVGENVCGRNVHVGKNTCWNVWARMCVVGMCGQKCVWVDCVVGM